MCHKYKVSDRDECNIIRNWKPSSCGTQRIGSFPCYGKIVGSVVVKTFTIDHILITYQHRWWRPSEGWREGWKLYIWIKSIHFLIRVYSSHKLCELKTEHLCIIIYVNTITLAFLFSPPLNLWWPVTNSLMKVVLYCSCFTIWRP